MLAIDPNAMRRLTSQMIRPRPWLQAAIVVYLLAAICLITVHQHHGALHGSDCALCTMSHTPAMLTSAADQTAEQTTAGALIPIPEDRSWAEETYQASRSRAPPQS
ncbi:MAG: hypothetical protein E6K79_11280 [Candidatus Eisenbacteria bacterium]|uniref:DUF2946 domain-containing protein n=1 Tax=Eiseniibacteriota bacterium TaxID=2212470 RepID=A0A538TGS4_UNCEI|nr:MAG: hypothetical protein E6K79_11280 [Candidatus Eisenbacteria bacterium]